MEFRIRDLIIAALGLLLLSPLLVVIALALALSQERVFFRQVRPGYRERPFTLVKFSTLRDAPPGWTEHERQQERLTAIGKYLRRFSLDELPQLWNVLRGDMSLVGPRPLLMEYLPLYSDRQRRRHHVMPGITGWAQIHGRNRLPFGQRFELDLWYVDHKSFWLDARILLHTIWQALRAEGVYADNKTTSKPFRGNQS